MTISFIIPIFNTSQYLDKCLESVYNQNLYSDDFEVIAINDGSTDDSLTILEKWQLKHKNIVILNQKNQGLSIARNNGLSSAQGRYVQFIDSDDWLVPKTAERNIELCTLNDLDILSFNMQRVNSTGDITINIKNKQFLNRIFSGEYLLTNANIEAPVWKFIIRRELFVENKLEFHPNMLHEDEEFTPRLFVSAKRVMLTNTVGYNYFIRANSITQDNRKREKSLEDKQKALFLLLDNINEANSTTRETALKNRINQLIVDIYLSIGLMKNCRDHYNNFKKNLEVNRVKFNATRNLSYKGLMVWLTSKTWITFRFIKWILTYRTN